MSDPEGTGSGASPGLFASLRSFWSVLLAILYTRLDLVTALKIPGRSGQAVADRQDVVQVGGGAFQRFSQLLVRVGQIGGRRQVAGRHGFHDAGEYVPGGGGEKDILACLFEFVAEYGGRDLVDLFTSDGRVAGKITEEVPHHAARLACPHKKGGLP